MAKQKMQNGGFSCDMGLLTDGNVAIQFNEPVREARFTPEQAISLGVGLIKLGTHGESVQRVQPPGSTAAMPRRKQ